MTKCGELKHDLLFSVGEKKEKIKYKNWHKNMTTLI